MEGDNLIKFYKPKRYDYITFHQYRFINTSKFSVSINKIISADAVSTLPHDHACDFASIVLWGRYTEKVYKDYLNNPNDVKKRSFRIFSFHKFLHNWAHIIIECKNAYTLFVTWNHQGRKPYIYTPDGAVTFQEYFSKKMFLKYGIQDPIEEFN
jgi:hypothetical protein